MDFQIVWTDPALEDLRDIVLYLSWKDANAAERVGNDIVDHVAALQAFPMIGPVYPRGAPSDRREIICGKYRIFYRVIQEPQRVEVLAIWHGARRDPEFF